MVTRGTKMLFRTKLTDHPSEDIEGAGTLRQEGENFYRWVRNVSGSTFLIGQPVVYDIGGTTAAGGADFHHEVVIPVTADLNTFAGIGMSAPADDEYFWIQIEGYYGSIRLSYGKTDITAGVRCLPVDTCSYLVGLSAAQHSISVVSTANQFVGWVHLAQSIGSSGGSAAGSDAVTTQVKGFIHCLTV